MSLSSRQKNQSRQFIVMIEPKPRTRDIRGRHPRRVTKEDVPRARNCILGAYDV